jgi:predicted MFS family arabinose efflux permease
VAETLTDAQPGGLLHRAALRRVVAVLSTTVITSYGVLYYAFPVLLTRIVDDTGWSAPSVTAAFSASQVVAAFVGIAVGRALDRRGPRAVMTAGSLLALPGLCLIALAPTYPVFVAGWLVVGIAMAGLLYPPAFAALTHWSGHRRVRALTMLTLVAGLASTVFAPLTAVLGNWLDWRWAYLTLAVILGVITLPAHWFGLRHPWTAHRRERRDGEQRGDSPSVARTRPFILLAVSLSAVAFAVYATLVNQVPLLVERGFTPELAALALGLGGIGQVTGRLSYGVLAARTSPVTRTLLVIGFVALTTALLGIVPGPEAALITAAILLGVGRGMFTLIQATAVSDRWGTQGFGRLNGLMSAPGLFLAAVAPFAGAALAELTGGYDRAFLVLALLAAVAVVVAIGSKPVENRR